MSYLAKAKKEDLKILAQELRLVVSEDFKVIEIKDVILKSDGYEEEFTRELLNRIISERKEKEKQLEREGEMLEKEKERLHELEKLKLSSGNPESENSTSGTAQDSDFPKLELRKLVPSFNAKTDDMSLFLNLFERQMSFLKVPQTKWVVYLVGLLSNDVAKLIVKENDENTQNYEHVKQILLRRFKLSAEKFRQLFTQHRKGSENTWRDFYFDLRNFLEGWLSELKVATFDQLKELMIADQIKVRAPSDYKEHFLDKWSSWVSPSEIADALDEYESVRADAGRKDSKNFKEKFTEKFHSFSTVSNVPYFKNKNSVTGKHISKPQVWKSAEPDMCYNCYERGHFSRDCPKPKRQKYCTKCRKEGHGTKDCKEVSAKSSSSLCVSNSVPNSDFRKYKNINIDGVNSLSCVLDTASTVSLIKPKLVSRLNKIEETVTEKLKGIGGTLTPYAAVFCDIKIDDVDLKSIRFLVVPDDAFSGADVLIGTDVIDLPNVAMVRKQGQTLLMNDADANFFQNFKVEVDRIPKLALKSKNSVSIPPHTVQFVESMTDDFPENTFIVEGEDLLKPCIYVKDGTACVPIVNFGETPVNIKENDVVLRGTACPIIDTVFCDDSNLDEHSISDVLNSASGLDDYETVEQTLQVDVNDQDNCREPLNMSQIKTGPKITEVEKQKLCNLLNEFRDCIAVKSDELGCAKTTPMRIVEVPGSKPVTHSPYRASYHEREILRKIVNELKRQGVVQDSSSEYSSPVLLVKKKTGEYRMVIDYRRLNAQTVKDKFPLPCIDDLLDKLGGYNLFCVLDAAQGFNQIPLEPESMRKAAFVTPDGHFEPTRLFFGLTNGPAVFQRTMTVALGDIMWNVVTCFIDDMLIGAKTFEDMISRLRTVLLKLRNASITLKLSKCEFAMEKIEYLGFLISSKGIQPGPRKLAAISEFPTPRTVKDVRRFLGLASFFRRFIEKYATLASPLTRLLKKDVEFIWSVDQQSAFDELKQRLTTQPVLKLYDYRDETELHTDASSVGLAGMLFQRDRDHKLRLVYCVSRRTSPDEANYHSSRLELIAVVWSMTRLRPLLIGKHFTLVTDCSAITFLKTQRNLKAQIARWAELLSEFDYDVKHRAGERMCHVDALSRAPIDERSCTPECEIELTSPVELTEVPQTFYIATQDDQVTLLQTQDKDLQKIFHVLKKPQYKRTKAESHLANQYVLENGIIYKIITEGNKMKKLYVIPRTMRKYLAVRYHDFTGHFGVDKVRQLIKEKFWFPNMTSYIKQHIQQCVSCAFHKVPGGKVQGKLNPIPPGKRPFELIHIDFLGPFVRSSRRNTEVFVIVDNLTKFVRLRACSSCSTSNALKFINEFILDFGVPVRIVSDRGSCFTSQAFIDFCSEKKIKHTFTCSQRPQANGQVERINRTLLPAISMSCRKDNQKDWDVVLPEVQRQINWAPSKSTGKSPFELLYGYIPEFTNDFPIDLLPEEGKYCDPNILQEEAKQRICKSQVKMKKHYDQRHCDATKYNVGDVVLIKRLREQSGTSTKLQVHYRGPLVVQAVLPSDTYQVGDLRIAGQGRKRKKNYKTTVHASQMKLYHLLDTEEDIEIDDEVEDNEQLMHNADYSCVGDDVERVKLRSRPSRIKRIPSYLKDYKLI